MAGASAQRLVLKGALSLPTPVLRMMAFTGVVPCADVACRETAGLVRESLEGRTC